MRVTLLSHSCSATSTASRSHLAISIQQAKDAERLKQSKRGRWWSRARYDTPESFVAALAGAPARSGPSLGLGEDVRIQGNGIVGCALVHGSVAHLTAFPEG